MIVKVLEVETRDAISMVRGTVELPSGQLVSVQWDGSVSALARNVHAQMASQQRFATVKDAVQVGMEIDCGDGSVAPPGTYQVPRIVTDEEIAKAIYLADLRWLNRRILDECRMLPDPDPTETVAARERVIAARMTYPQFEELG